MKAPSLALGSVLGLALGACFTGEATLGAICTEDTQCGLDQVCTNSVCGQCKDGEVQAGEVCFGAASEELAFGEVTELIAFDIDFDEAGTKELMAVVNDDCGGIGGECWDLHLLLSENGDFEAYEIFEENVPGRVPDMTLGNFDGNDLPDLVVVIVPLDPDVDPSQLAVLNDFPSSLISTDIDVAIAANSLETGDFDGNGFDDIVIGAEEANTLVIIPSTGGGFGSERVLVTDASPRLAPPVDMNGDGSIDLIIASAFFATVGVDLNDGSGNFTPQTRIELGEGLFIHEIEIGDFDSDGVPDVVAVAGGSEDGTVAPLVAVLRGLGNGEFEPLVGLPGGELPVDVLAEDVNGDGLTDIMVADFLEDKLPVWINRGGSFPDQIGIDVAAAPLTLLRGDFDFDNQIDLVIGNANGVISVVRAEN